LVRFYFAPVLRGREMRLRWFYESL